MGCPFVALSGSSSELTQRNLLPALANLGYSSELTLIYSKANYSPCHHRLSQRTDSYLRQTNYQLSPRGLFFGFDPTELQPALASAAPSSNLTLVHTKASTSSCHPGLSSELTPVYNRTQLPAVASAGSSSELTLTCNKASTSSCHPEIFSELTSVQQSTLLPARALL